MPGSATRGNGCQDASLAPASARSNGRRAALPAAAADASDSDWSPPPSASNAFHDEDLLISDDGEDADLNVEAVVQAERRKRQR